MSISISSNTSSLRAQTSVLANEQETRATLAKLSSGKRVNSAQDNAANLAIGVALAAQLGSSNQAVSNAGDAEGIADTADAALGDTSDILARLDELAVQSASGALSPSDRANIQTEGDALTSELDRVANATEFNGAFLLNASASLPFQIGIGNVPSNDQIAISTGNATYAALGLSGVNLSTQSGAQSALGSLDTAIQAVSSTRAVLGAQANRAASAINTGTQASLSLAAAGSSVSDADIAEQASNLSRNLILGQAGVSVLAQANQEPQRALKLLGA